MILDQNRITALIDAVMVESIEIVQLLLNRGTNTQIIDRRGRTALMWAQFRENEEIMAF